MRYFKIEQYVSEDVFFENKNDFLHKAAFADCFVVDICNEARILAACRSKPLTGRFLCDALALSTKDKAALLDLFHAKQTPLTLACDRGTLLCFPAWRSLELALVFLLEADLQTVEKCLKNAPRHANSPLFEKAEELFGKIDIFYANAGYPYYEVFDYVDWDRTKRMFETNVFSPIYTYQKYREHLNGREGHYAMTVSAIGKMAMPGFATYSASKFALEGWQQGIRFENPKNIKLTCLYPIATDTGFFKAANEVDFEKPFPVQSPRVVAKKMVAALEKGKKSCNPSGLFTLSGVLFSVCPPIKSTYLALEKQKFNRFAKKNRQRY